MNPSSTIDSPASAGSAGTQLSTGQVQRSGGSMSSATVPVTDNVVKANLSGRMLSAMQSILWFMFAILMSPLKAYLSLRRSMTIASVTTLLAAFLTLNVIWGFPWSGMMGACLAMMVVGLAINRLTGPHLKASVSLPRTAVAGNPFSINVRLMNARKIPAIQLRVGWHEEGVRDPYPRKTSAHWDASPPVSVDLLRGGDQMQWHGAMRMDRRGIHPLPPFQVSSTFPFHLFRVRKSIDTATQIAITPAPANSNDDPTSRAMLAAIGDWSRHMVAGAPVEYVGNREYQVGVPVRRWDFASWARLGRPIVREYQSPSIQAVALIVDTSAVVASNASLSRAAAKQRQRTAEASFERLLSIAATSITEISSRRVQLKLYLTNESSVDVHSVRSNSLQGEGTEAMLVRLAAAATVHPQLGEQRIRDAIEASRSHPTLVLSLLSIDGDDRREFGLQLPPNVTYLAIKPASFAQTDALTGATNDR